MSAARLSFPWRGPIFKTAAECWSRSETLVSKPSSFGRVERNRQFGTLSTRLESLISYREAGEELLKISRKSLSTSSSAVVDDNENDGPWGDLFSAPIGMELVGKTASIRRTFGSRSNAQGFLVCGGEALAKHASFDLDYGRAQGWIRHHAVGPAVLSPVLIAGLVGALVEAALPQSVPISSSMKQIRPLIVGVEVCAKIEVASVNPDDSGFTESDNIVTKLLPNEDQNDRKRQHGYQIGLKTVVSRVQDDVAVAEGRHYVWIPDYLHM